MSRSPSNSDDARVRREAAAWLARLDRGLSAAEQDEFLQWLAASARHRSWLSRHRAGWDRLDGSAHSQSKRGPARGPQPRAIPTDR